MVNLKHLSVSYWEHLMAEPKSKICSLNDGIPQSKRWWGWGDKEGYLLACACETEVAMEEPSSHTTWHSYESRRNWKVYHYFNSGGVWKLHVKDAILIQSSSWSLAKQTHKRDIGCVFFGREAQSELLSSETLYHLWRERAEIVAGLCILQGTHKEAGNMTENSVVQREAPRTITKKEREEWKSIKI